MEFAVKLNAGVLYQTFYPFFETFSRVTSKLREKNQKMGTCTSNSWSWKYYSYHCTELIDLIGEVVVYVNFTQKVKKNQTVYIFAYSRTLQVFSQNIVVCTWFVPFVLSRRTKISWLNCTIANWNWFSLSKCWKETRLIMNFANISGSGHRILPSIISPPILLNYWSRGQGRLKRAQNWADTLWSRNHRRWTQKLTSFFSALECTVTNCFLSQRRATAGEA